jgi:hypothetical protein
MAQIPRVVAIFHFHNKSMEKLSRLSTPINMYTIYTFPIGMLEFYNIICTE